MPEQVTRAAMASVHANVVADAIAALPEMRAAIVRRLARIVTRGGPLQSRAARRLIQDIYQATRGHSPVGRHGFRHFLEESLGAVGDDVPDASMADAFEALDIEITP